MFDCLRTRLRTLSSQKQSVFILLLGVILLTTTMVSCSASAQNYLGVKDSSSVVLYMVMTDRFYNGDKTNDLDVEPKGDGSWHGGDFKGLEQKMGYLSDLGVNAVWISPVVQQIDHPVGDQKFDHWPFHGYWAEDLTKLDPHWGSEEDFHSMIASAHKNNIRIILDVVLNHAGYGSVWEKKADWIRSETLKSCPKNFTDLDQCLFGLPDFRTEKAEVATYLIQASVDWIKKFPVDGVRIDTVKHVEKSVWKQFSEQLRIVRPGFWILGEAWGTDPANAFGDQWLDESDMDVMFDFAFGSNTAAYLNGRMRTVAFSHHLAQRHRRPDKKPYVHYLNSHDVDPFLTMLENHELYPLAVVMQMTVHGIPLIYYGDELARVGAPWPKNRMDMPWEILATDEHAKEIHGLYKELIKLRMTSPALTHGVYSELYSGDNTLVFLQKTPAENTEVAYGIVAINKSSEPVMVEIDLSEITKEGLKPDFVWPPQSGQAKLIQDNQRAQITIPAQGAWISCGNN